MKETREDYLNPADMSPAETGNPATSFLRGRVEHTNILNSLYAITHYARCSTTLNMLFIFLCGVYLCVLNVSSTLSLPHANVWLSLSAWKERRWYNNTVPPYVILLPFLALCYFSAMHALAHILLLFFYREGDRVICLALCKYINMAIYYDSMLMFNGLHHRDTTQLSNC